MYIYIYTYTYWINGPFLSAGTVYHRMLMYVYIDILSRAFAPRRSGSLVWGPGRGRSDLDRDLPANFVRRLRRSCILHPKFSGPDSLVKGPQDGRATLLLSAGCGVRAYKGVVRCRFWTMAATLLLSTGCWDRACCVTVLSPPHPVQGGLSRVVRGNS